MILFCCVWDGLVLILIGVGCNECIDIIFGVVMLLIIWFGCLMFFWGFGIICIKGLVVIFWIWLLIGREEKILIILIVGCCWLLFDVKLFGVFGLVDMVIFWVVIDVWGSEVLVIDC